MREERALAAQAVSVSGRAPLASGICLSLFALALLLLGPPVTPTQAAVTHTYSFSFGAGELSNPGSIAVDERTGDVYVLDLGTRTLDRFDSGGAPDKFSLLPSNVIDGAGFGEADYSGGGWSFPSEIAIDNSGGPNDGDIYVAHNSGVDVFEPSGRFIATMSNRSIDESPNQQSICGVTTSSDGSVYLAHLHNYVSELGLTYVDRFRPGEWNPFAVPSQVWPVMSSLQNIPDGACMEAADASGDIYATDAGEINFLSSPPVVPSGKLRRFSSNMFDLNRNAETAGVVIGNEVKDVAVDSLTGDVYAARGSSIARYGSDGPLLETLAAGEVGSTAGVGVNGATGTVYVSDTAAGEVRAYEGILTPDISSVSATAGATTATIAAHLGTAGAGAVTSCEIEYGQDESYGATVPCNPSPPYIGSEDTSTGIGGLSPETTYHYRLVAGNAAGEDLGIDHVFTTHAVADVETEAPTDITQTSATLTGSFTGHGESVSYDFQWGTSTGYGHQTNVKAIPTALGLTHVTGKISGLTAYTPPGLTYHYRLVASNSAGTTRGPDRSFHTSPPPPPQIEGSAVAQVSDTSAVFESEIDPNQADTLYLFEYGTSSSYGLQTAEAPSIAGDSAFHAVSQAVSDLLPGTQYHYRAVAFNFGGASYGPDRLFTTAAAPSIEASGISNPTQASVLIHATIASNLGATTYYVQSGTSQAYGSQTDGASAIGADLADHEVTVPITGLSAGTIYHARVVAANSFGVAYGPDLTVSTEPAPPPIVNTACTGHRIRRHGKCVPKRRHHVRKSHRRGSRGPHHA